MVQTRRMDQQNTEQQNRHTNAPGSSGRFAISVQYPHNAARATLNKQLTASHSMHNAQLPIHTQGQLPANSRMQYVGAIPARGNTHLGNALPYGPKNGNSVGQIPFQTALGYNQMSTSMFHNAGQVTPISTLPTINQGTFNQWSPPRMERGNIPASYPNIHIPGTTQMSQHCTSHTQSASTASSSAATQDLQYDHPMFMNFSNAATSAPHQTTPKHTKPAGTHQQSDRHYIQSHTSSVPTTTTVASTPGKSVKNPQPMQSPLVPAVRHTSVSVQTTTTVPYIHQQRMHTSTVDPNMGTMPVPGHAHTMPAPGSAHTMLAPDPCGPTTASCLQSGLPKQHNFPPYMSTYAPRPLHTTANGVGTVLNANAVLPASDQRVPTTASLQSGLPQQDNVLPFMSTYASTPMDTTAASVGTVQNTHTMPASGPYVPTTVSFQSGLPQQHNVPPFMSTYASTPMDTTAASVGTVQNTHTMPASGPYVPTTVSFQSGLPQQHNVPPFMSTYASTSIDTPGNSQTSPTVTTHNRSLHRTNFGLSHQYMHPHQKYENDMTLNESNTISFTNQNTTMQSTGALDQNSSAKPISSQIETSNHMIREMGECTNTPAGQTTNMTLTSLSASQSMPQSTNVHAPLPGTNNIPITTQEIETEDEGISNSETVPTIEASENTTELLQTQYIAETEYSNFLNPNEGLNQGDELQEHRESPKLSTNQPFLVSTGDCDFLISVNDDDEDSIDGSNNSDDAVVIDSESDDENQKDISEPKRDQTKRENENEIIEVLDLDNEQCQRKETKKPRCKIVYADSQLLRDMGFAMYASDHENDDSTTQTANENAKKDPVQIRDNAKKNSLSVNVHKTKEKEKSIVVIDLESTDDINQGSSFNSAIKLSSSQKEAKTKSVEPSQTKNTYEQVRGQESTGYKVSIGRLASMSTFQAVKEKNESKFHSEKSEDKKTPHVKTMMQEDKSKTTDEVEIIGIKPSKISSEDAKSHKSLLNAIQAFEKDFSKSMSYSHGECLKKIKRDIGKIMKRKKRKAKYFSRLKKKIQLLRLELEDDDWEPGKEKKRKLATKPVNNAIPISTATPVTNTLTNQKSAFTAPSIPSMGLPRPMFLPPPMGFPLPMAGPLPHVTNPAQRPYLIRAIQSAVNMHGNNRILLVAPVQGTQNTIMRPHYSPLNNQFPNINSNPNTFSKSK